jgi:hypothetical protein
MEATDLCRLREPRGSEPSLKADICRSVAGESRAERCDRKKALKPAAKRELEVGYTSEGFNKSVSI